MRGDEGCGEIEGERRVEWPSRDGKFFVTREDRRMGRNTSL